MKDVTADAELLKRSIEHSMVAHSIALAEGDFPLIYVNEQFEKQTGYSAQEVLGKNCRFLQGDDTDPETVRAIKSALLKAEPIDTEILNYTKDGRPFWNRLRMTPVFDEAGGLVYFVGVQSDITYIKERENERINYEASKLDTLRRLSFNLAHEIKNCVQPIKLMSEIISETSDKTESTGKAVQVIDESVSLLEKILQDMLHFAKGSELVTEDVPVSELVACIDSLAKGVEEEGVAISLDVDEGLDMQGCVRVSIRQFQQITLNLLQNASHAGAKNIKVTFKQETPYLCMQVCDDGCGMSAQIMKNIFEAFYTTKPAEQGTGLGLAVVKMMVEQMDGRITVDSKPGDGSCFYISIPAIGEII